MSEAAVATPPALREQPCLLCGASEPREIKRFDDGVVVGECTRCGFLYTPLRSAEPALLLAGNTIEELRVLYRPILEGRVPYYRQRVFDYYRRRIDDHAPGRRLLDVGCAFGFFPASAQKAGFHVTAVEPAAPMARFARELLGVNVLHGRLDQVDLGDAEFDAISFTDSLEYIPDPLRDVGRALGHLVQGGVLFVKVPNGDYFRLRHELQARLGIRTGTHDEAFGPSYRVAHYTVRTLRALAERLGLEVLDVSACPPIDSPVWFRHTGLPLESEAPWFLGLGGKVLRRALDRAGRLESALAPGSNHFSQAIQLLARKP